jgi:hypothetical protein
VGYDGLTHLEVIGLLDLGRGGVGADLQDIVVRAVLHHTGSAHNRTPTTDVAAGSEGFEIGSWLEHLNGCGQQWEKGRIAGSLTFVRMPPGGD